MEQPFENRPLTTALILCCQCGTQIEPNPTNMCVACLRTQVDITEGIPKQGVLYFCRNCERYLQPPNHWVAAQLESRELLSVCLKKLGGLKSVRLIDAGFVWTEPHSQRIKTKLTVQKEVLNGALLQQVFVVEFIVKNHMCDDCHRVEAKDFWRACVQIRQKTKHKKTFYYLEQIILKHKAHANTVNIKPFHEGLDFFYVQNQDARKLVDFLSTVVPCRYGMAEELISHDIHNNTFNYKHTYSVEIVPICKDNIVCLPPKLAQQMGNINPLCLCYKVTNALHFIDPASLQVAEMKGAQFWRYPFLAVCEPKELKEYMVIDVDIVPDKDKPHRVPVSQKDKPHRVPVSQKHVLADVCLQQISGTGLGDQQFYCRTHLGHLLNPGDTVMGFNFTNSNINHAEFDKLKADKIPDVMLVKKIFGDKSTRNKKRKWKLRHLHDDLHAETASNERDYTDFLEDLEEDPTYRQNVDIYKDSSKIAVDTDDTDDEGLPQVSLQEMLDDLHISTDATGADGADMMTD